MKRKYNKPKIETIAFTSESIITLSGVQASPTQQAQFAVYNKAAFFKLNS